MLERPSDIENRYFLAKEQEQREKLRERLQREAEALKKDREIAKSSGTEDPKLAIRLRRLGFDGDTAKVLDLMPLVHVAWADGTVQYKERAMILHVLEERGFEPGSDVARFVESMLEHRPPESFLEESLDALHDMLDAKGKSGVDVVDMCATLAEEAGGYFGLGGEISKDERKLIAHIAEVLGDKAVAEFKKIVGRR